MGQFTYANNPNLYLTSENNNRSMWRQVLLLDAKMLGQQILKITNWQQVHKQPSLWVSNTEILIIGFLVPLQTILTDSYIDIAPLTRTSNFADDGGIPFNDYDPEIAKIPCCDRNSLTPISWSISLVENRGSSENTT